MKTNKQKKPNQQHMCVTQFLVDSYCEHISLKNVEKQLVSSQQLQRPLEALRSHTQKGPGQLVSAVTSSVPLTDPRARFKIDPLLCWTRLCRSGPTPRIIQD